MKPQVVRRSEVHLFITLSLVILVWSIDLGRWELFWCVFTLVQHLFESHSWSQTNLGHFCSFESRNGPRCCLNDKILEGDRLQLFPPIQRWMCQDQTCLTIYCLTSKQTVESLFFSTVLILCCKAFNLKRVYIFFFQFHFAIFTLAWFVLFFLIDDRTISQSRVSNITHTLYITLET